MQTIQTPRAPRVEVSIARNVRFQRNGRTYDRAEMTSYHTTDPAVPTVFQSLRDGTVFMRISDGEIKAVDDREVPKIAQRYCVPELVRPLRRAG